MRIIEDKDQFPEISGSGGGASKGSSHTPVEAPNTLQSVVKGRILDLIAYGPIYGLVDGLKSVYLDDTVVMNEDGSVNFQGISIETREGYPNQTYMGGFPTVENSIEIGTEILFDKPPVRSVSNNDADAALITVQFAALVVQKDNGDTSGAQVRIMIDVRSAGGAWVEKVNNLVDGKTTSPFPITYRVNLKEVGDGPYDVRVRRGNKESQESKLQDKVTWTLINEVIDARLSYPSMALVGISIDSKLFGSSMPSRSYDVKLSIISVPSNYDPIARTYTGLWDGTFKQAWTDNPAWCYYDLATHPVIGGGLQDVDKWVTYKIGQYCDQLVPDGYGGMEPRFTCNTIFSAQEDAISALNTFASCFRGMAYWGTNTMVPVADMPAPIRKIVGPANVQEGEFEYVGTSIRERHSVCVVMWNDPNDNGKATPEVYEDPHSIDMYGWVETRVTAVACNSRGQARRLAKWILYSERMETQTLTYSAAPDHADLRPGDLIEVADPYYQGPRMAGRVVSATNRLLVLDQVPDAQTLALSGDWFLSVLMPDGSIARSEVSSFAPNNQVTLIDLLPNVPEPGFMWALSSTALELPQFRIVSVTEDGNNYKVTATEYDPRKYDIVELDLQLPDRPTSTLPSGAIAAPLELTFQVYKYQAGDGEHQGVVVSWTPPRDARIDSYVLDVMDPSATGFRTVYNGAGVSFDLQDATAGQWTFRVRSVSQGIPSQWVSRTVQIAMLLLPVPPDSVDVKVNALDITLTPRSGYPDQVYEFWRSLSPLQPVQVEASATQLATGTYLVDTGLKPDTLYYYFVRGVNQYGKSGWYGVQARTSNDFGEITKAMLEELRQGLLYQQLVSQITITAQPLIDQARADLDAALLDLQETVTDVGTQVGVVNQEIGSVNNQIGDINTELDSIRDDLANVTDALAYVPDNDYVVKDIVRGGQKLYQAIAAVPAKADGSNGPPNVTYWKDVGDIVSDANGLSSRVTLVENRVTANEGTLTSYGSQINQINTTLTGKADSSALQTLTSRVTAAEGSITSQGQAITNLTNSVAGKADASALQALTTRVSTAEGTISSQGTALTSLNNAIAGKADASTVASLTNTVTQQGTALTAAGNAITTINASLSNSGSQNLLYNPAFTGTALPSGLAPGWAAYVPDAPGASNGAYSLVPSFIVSTEKSQRVDVTGLNTSSLHRSLILNDAYTPKVVAGNTVTASIYFRGTPGLQVRIFIQARDSAHAALSSPSSALMSVTSASQRIVFTYENLPANTAEVQIFYRIYAGASVTAGFVEFTRAQLEIGNQVSGWKDNTQAVAADVLAAAQATSALTSRVTQTETTLTSQSNQLTSLSASLGNVGGENLVYNPSFDRVSLIPSFADGWASDAAGGTRLFSLVKSTMDPAGLAQRIDFTGISSTIWQRLWQNANRTLLSPGTAYVASVYVRATAGTMVKIQVNGQDDNNVGTATWQTDLVPATGNWQRLWVPVSPTGVTTRGNCGVVIYGTAAVTAGFLEVDQYQLEVGTVVTGFRDNTQVTESDVTAQANATTALTARVTQTETTLTSQTTQVTNLTNNLSTAGGDNLLPNSSFDDLVTGSTTRPKSWSAGGTTTFTYSLVDSPLPASNKAFRVGAASIAANGSIEVAYQPGDGVTHPSVNGGKSYTLSVFARAGIGSGLKTFAMYIQFYDVTKQVLLSTPTLVESDITDTFQRYTLTGIAPINAAFANIYAGRVFNRSGGTTTLWMEVDNVQFQEGAVATGYSSSVKQSADAASAATAALTSRVTQTEQGLTSQSTNITNLVNSLGDAGSDNLLPNSSFEDFVNGAPTYWQLGGSAVPTLTQVDSTLPSSKKAARLVRAAMPVNGYMDINSTLPIGDKPNVVEGQTYTLSAYARSVSSLVRFTMYVQWMNAAGQVVSTTQSAEAIPTTAFARYQFSSVCPVGATKANVYAGRFFNRGTAAADIWGEIDNVQFEIGATANGYKASIKATGDALSVTSAAVDALTSTVTQQGTTLTSVGSRTTSLENAINSTTSGLNTKATASALDTLTNRVTAAEGVNTSQSASITDLNNSIGGSIDTAPGALWNFDSVNNPDGWAPSGCTFGYPTLGILRITSTGTDPGISIGGLSIPGVSYNRVRLLVTRRAGTPTTDWDGTCYYQTANHGFVTGYRKTLPNPNLAVGASAIIDFDMNSLTAGGGDWASSTITALRIDLGNSNGGVFDIDWIAVGRVAPAASSRAVAALTSTVTQQGGTISAQASDLSNLNVVVGNQSAAIQQHSSAIADSQGKIAATYTVKLGVTANGQYWAAGFGLSLDNSVGANLQSKFIVSADSFWILNSNATASGAIYSPFFVTGGAVYIQNAFIQDASIGTAKIADAAITTAKIGVAEVDTLRIRGNAVTVPTSANNNQVSTGTGIDAWQAIIAVAVPMDQAGIIQCSFSCTQNFGSGIRYYGFRMMINGQVISQFGGQWADGFPQLASSIAVAPGTFVMQVDWYGQDAGVQISNKNIFAMGSKR